MNSKSRLPVQLLAVVLCATPVAAQENRGTPEQRAACTPDAFRFCVGYIPDPTRVEDCLRRNMPDLSAACRSVFEKASDVLAGGSSQVTRANDPARDLRRGRASAQ